MNIQCATTDYYELTISHIVSICSLHCSP